MRLAWVGVGAAALSLVGCRATTVVSVAVGRTGGGTVSVSLVLDRQGAARVGPLQVGDLVASGWKVTGPSAALDGSVTEVVSHPFASPADAARLLGSLGPAVRLDVHRARGVTTSRLGVTGNVDLRGGVDTFADTQLLAALGTPSLAASLRSLSQSGDTPPTLGVRVVASLPGRPAAVAGGGRIAGNTVTWDVPMGGSTSIGAATRVTEHTDIRWLEAAAASLLGLAVVVAAGWRRARARRHRDHWSLARVTVTPHP